MFYYVFSGVFGVLLVNNRPKVRYSSPYIDTHTLKKLD